MQPLRERPEALTQSANSMDLGSALQWTKAADTERLDSSARAGTSGFAVSCFLCLHLSPPIFLTKINKNK